MKHDPSEPAPPQERNEPDPKRPPNEIPADRLSRMAEACLGIASNLDIDAVLQGVIDGARALTGARYGALVSFDDSGGIRDLVTSGMTPHERQGMGAPPKGLGLLGYLNEVPRLLRLRDIASHPRSVGFPENHPPMKTFLGTPVRHLGEPVGNIYLTEKEEGRDFTTQDEDILVLFAAQAAMAIANALSHRAEQQARADLEALINISPVGVLVFHAKTGELISANDEAKRIFGKLNAPGRTIDQFLEVVTLRTVDGRDIPPDELPTAKALRTGGTVLADEIVIHLPDGRAVTTLVNARPIYEEDDEVGSVVATIQDITPLEEMRRQRANFLGMVSHELRTPLAAVKGSTTTMLNSHHPLDPVETRQLLQIIDEQADHMRHLINDLVDMTHIEAGTLSVTPEPTDVESLLDQARESFISEGVTNSIAVDLAPDLPRIMADRHRMLQVLSSLITSASEHSPESSIIRVSASAEDACVAISVENNDRSATPDHAPHPYRELPPTGSESMDGKNGIDGLGLTVCRGIVEAHGGRISAETLGPGHGVRFTLKIPAADETEYSAETGSGQPTSHLRQPTRDQVHVLTVYDDPQTRRYIHDILLEAGFISVMTGNPDDIGPLAEAHQPHLILIDTIRPGTDGFELTMKRIRRVSDTPVILVSRHRSGPDMDRAFDLGAADYVVKPFTPMELVARIKATVRNRPALVRTTPSEPFVLGDLTIDYAARLVTVAGRRVQLTTTEYKLLFELAAADGAVLTHQQLLRLVWGPAYDGNMAIVYTYVNQLRNKLGDTTRRPAYILTEPRVGYRMAKPANGP